MVNFTDKQVKALNDWARVQPALRYAFSYLNHSSNGPGFGDGLIWLLYKRKLISILQEM